MIAVDDAHATGQRELRATAIPTGLLALAVCLYLTSETQADPDLWGHLRFGLDNLATRSIARIDPYSFVTAGTEWINHEWLAEVIFALVYSLGGATALIGLKTVLALCVGAIVLSEVVHHGVPLIRSLVPFCLMLFISRIASLTVRPHIFTLVCFSLTVWAISRREAGSRWSLWLLPPLFALWVNLHGGFLAGIGVLSVWMAMRVVSAAHQVRFRPCPFAREIWPDALPITVAFLATLVNPYFVGLWTFLLRTATIPRPEITEWAPLPIVGLLGALYFGTLALTGAAIRCSRQPFSLASSSVYACLVILPLVAVRHLPLMAIGTTLLAVPHFRSAFERWLGEYRPPAARLVAVPLIVISAVVGYLISVPLTLRGSRS